VEAVEVRRCLLALHLTGKARYGDAVERTFRHTRHFADFAFLASPGIVGEATYWAWFPQPSLDR